MSARTDPATEEEVYATYLATASYAKTGRKCGIPRRTVWDIVQRLGHDELAQDRLAARADLARAGERKLWALLKAVRIDGLGTEKSSASLEAARAIGEVSRMVSVLQPTDVETEQQPTTINVNVSMKPPRELAAITATTTTTLGPIETTIRRGPSPPGEGGGG